MRELKNCRICQSDDLISVLNLGHHPPSNSFLTAASLRQPETTYPLEVLTCQQCGLSQLSVAVPKRILFAPDYPYDSSTSQTFRSHFRQMAHQLCDQFALGDGSLAVDIGSNTGALLEGFKERGCSVVGIEPADSMAQKANDKGIFTLNDFFSPEVADGVVRDFQQADIITATNVFAHIDDLDEVAQGLRTLMSPNGVFVAEAQYFLDMVQHVEYDMIYHEHLSYMTVQPLVYFFRNQGLELFDVELIETHGGSIRIYAGFPGRHNVTKNVDNAIKNEISTGVVDPSGLADFSKQVRSSKDQLLGLLYSLKLSGKKIVGIGAPAKGNTLINYCKISSDLLEYITEKAEDKIGLFSPGMHIPVVPESSLFESRPDYGVVLAWNLKSEIMQNLRAFEENGGQFIIPMPSVTIVK